MENIIGISTPNVPFLTGNKLQSKQCWLKWWCLCSLSLIWSRWETIKQTMSYFNSNERLRMIYVVSNDHSRTNKNCSNTSGKCNESTQMWCAQCNNAHSRHRNKWIHWKLNHWWKSKSKFQVQCFFSMNFRLGWRCYVYHSIEKQFRSTSISNIHDVMFDLALFYPVINKAPNMIQMNFSSPKVMKSPMYWTVQRSKMALKIWTSEIIDWLAHFTSTRTRGKVSCWWFRWQILLCVSVSCIV